MQDYSNLWLYIAELLSAKSPTANCFLVAEEYSHLRKLLIAKNISSKEIDYFLLLGKEETEKKYQDPTYSVSLTPKIQIDLDNTIVQYVRSSTL